MMRILAVDPGNARIGLAISDPGHSLARPLQILEHNSRAEDALRIAQIAAEHEAGLIVVGLALDAENRPTPQSRSSKRLAAAIRDASLLPVEFWEESFSSQDAESTLRVMGQSKKKRPVDDLAAARILQGYLNNMKHQESDAKS